MINTEIIGKHYRKEAISDYVQYTQLSTYGHTQQMEYHTLPKRSLIWNARAKEDEIDSLLD